MLDELDLGLLLRLVVGQKVHRFLEAPQVPVVKVLLWVLVDECWKRKKRKRSRLKS